MGIIKHPSVLLSTICDKECQDIGEHSGDMRHNDCNRGLAMSECNHVWWRNTDTNRTLYLHCKIDREDFYESSLQSVYKISAQGVYAFHRNPRAPLSEWKPYDQLTLDDLPKVD